MFERFSNWYHNYYAEITWFIIGILVMGTLESLAHENYTSALVNAALIVINYTFWKHNK